MKKKYSRPMLAFESFQLDAALAKNCEMILQYSTYNCSMDLSGMQYSGGGGEFFNYTNCQTDLIGDGPNNESTCYQAPVPSDGPDGVWAIFLQS